LPIPKIMMLLDETIIERLKGGVSNQLQSGSREMSEGSSKGAPGNGHSGNGAVSFMVVGTSKGWRKSDKPSSLQGQKELSAGPVECRQSGPAQQDSTWAGHIPQLTIGLHPIPLPTEHPRDLLSSPAPMGTNDGLDLGEILFSNGSSADRERPPARRGV